MPLLLVGGLVIVEGLACGIRVLSGGVLFHERGMGRASSGEQFYVHMCRDICLCNKFYMIA